MENNSIVARILACVSFVGLDLCNLVISESRKGSLGVFQLFRVADCAASFDILSYIFLAIYTSGVGCTELVYPIHFFSFS